MSAFVKLEDGTLLTAREASRLTNTSSIGGADDARLSELGLARAEIAPFLGTFHRRGDLVWDLSQTPALGSYTRVEKPLEEVKSIKRRQVSARFDAFVGAGFTYDFGAIPAREVDGAIGPAGQRVLQMDPRSRQEWSTTLLRLKGEPADDPALPIRSEDDALILVTAGQAVAALTALTDYLGAALMVRWAHKDAITLSPTFEEVVAYDITTGWPT